jgi:diaminopimelate decarboxylase
MADPGQLARRIVQDRFSVQGQDLSVGGVTLRAIAEQYGTPFFVYDAAGMRRNFTRLRAALADFATVFYSIKANPNPHVAQVFVTEGAGLEIASEGELSFALRAGGTPHRILAAGPGKSAGDLAAFVRAGIAEIHLESLDEARALDQIARAQGRVQTVSLRINPVTAATGGAMRMGGKPAVFGFDEEDMAPVAAEIGALSNLSLQGVHLFAGTQILDAKTLLTQWRHGLDVASRLAKQLGRPLASVDLGGGLGVPYHDGDATLDLDVLGAGVAELIALKATDPLIAQAHVIVEPGRYLTASSGVYAAQVLNVKTSRGHRFAVTDGGMHHHLAASGNLGQVLKRDYPVVAATRMREDANTAVTVSGPLCTPLDVLARQAHLPALAPGDLVAVLQSGAYGLTASPNGFLSHAFPPEILAEGGAARLIRPRINPDFWLAQGV